MSSIQSFNFKRKRITVIVWKNKVWFMAREIYDILGYRKRRRSLNQFICLLFNEPELQFSKGRVKLISDLGLDTFTYHKALTEKMREKAKELYEWFEKEVLPVLNLE